MTDKIKEMIESIHIYQHPTPLCFDSIAKALVDKSDFDRVVKELTIDKVYLVKYSQGDYDDIEVIDIFVTFNEETATNYMNRFNCLLEKYKKFYSKFEEVDSRGHKWIKDEYDDYYERWYQLTSINGCFIVEMEIR
jgi:hypothetical protein